MISSSPTSGAHVEESYHVSTRRPRSERTTWATCRKKHHLLICISGLFSGAKRQAEAEGCAKRTLSSYSL